ncbi:GNAT family N-acetyltransferase [Actinospica robiniae]|uniref:GNAT family N-acetyltransferase n=1 Tax=Actinospica robiniae TaxID=304901 RepID=UPI00041AEE65|nr:GNAT family protein [Actinospica robiniae]
MPATLVPIVLEGRHVRLEPLALDHVPALFQAGGGDEEVWRYLSAPTPVSEEELAAIVAKRLREVGAGRRIAFTVFECAQGTAIGTTNLHSWHVAEGRVEIGGTWFGRRWWRTAANTETKLLTMTHAFETLGFAKVLWRVDVGNTRSQAALARIGAQLQEHRDGAPVKLDGSRRDLLVYAMHRSEWAAAKTKLADRLALD